MAPLPDKIDHFPTNLELPTSVKSLQWYIGLLFFYKQNKPRLPETLIPLYQLLQKYVNFQLTQVHKVTIFNINAANLAKAAKLFLRLPLPGQQLVIMCYAKILRTMSYSFKTIPRITTNHLWNIPWWIWF